MRYIIAAFFCFSCVMANAQAESLFEKEQGLKALGDSILKSKNDSIRVSAAAIFETRFEDFLKDGGSFTYEFDSLKNISVLKSDDQLVRIYTWLLPSVNGESFHYYGFIQAKEKKTNTVISYKLQEAELNRAEAEKKIYDYKHWIGAIYYKIIEVKSKSESYYTLLGWKGNNKQSTIKLIEALKISKGIPKFGMPVFKTEKGMRHRVIFEYNARAVMSLKYEGNDKSIIFDHLSPANPALIKDFASYGPDFTYDGFKLNKGKWNFMKNIEMRNDSDFDKSNSPPKNQNKEFYNPEK